MDNNKFKELLVKSTQVDLTHRKELEKKLAKEAPHHVAALDEMVADEAVAVRRGAVEILRRIAADHDPALTLLLRRLSIEPDVKTRRRLAAAIADSGRREVSSTLLDQLEREEHRFVQASLILALGKLGFRDWPQSWLEYLDREGPVAEAVRKAVNNTSARAEIPLRPDDLVRRPSGTFFLKVYPGLEKLVRIELRLHNLSNAQEQVPGWIALPDITDNVVTRLGQLRTIIAEYHLALSVTAGRDLKATSEEGISEVLRAAPYLKEGCTFRLSLPMMETRADYRKLVVSMSRHIERISGWRNNPGNYDLDLRLIRFDSKEVIIWRDRRWPSTRRDEVRQVVPASIHPSVAAALCFAATEKGLSQIVRSRGEGKILLDPCCGAGTILREWLTLFTQARAVGYDISEKAVRLSHQNLGDFKSRCKVREADMRRIPSPDSSVDYIVCNLPFGVRVKHESPNRVLYTEFGAEAMRVLRKGGWLVTYTADRRAIELALQAAGWSDAHMVTKILAGGLEVSVHRVQKRLQWDAERTSP